MGATEAHSEEQVYRACKYPEFQILFYFTVKLNLD